MQLSWVSVISNAQLACVECYVRRVVPAGARRAELQCCVDARRATTDGRTHWLCVYCTLPPPAAAGWAHCLHLCSFCVRLSASSCERTRWVQQVWQADDTGRLQTLSTSHDDVIDVMASTSIHRNYHLFVVYVTSSMTSSRRPWLLLTLSAIMLTGQYVNLHYVVLWQVHITCMHRALSLQTVQQRKYSVQVMTRNSAIADKPRDASWVSQLHQHHQT